VADAFEGVFSDGQLAALGERALDARPALSMPFPALEDYLHRGGCHPGELVVLGGRKGTRKTCVMLSWAVHLLRQNVNVGVVTLDESLAMYVSKLMSVVFQVPSDFIEDNWDSPRIREMRDEYEALARGLTLTTGARPNMASLQQWLEETTVHDRTPRVVFIDYLSLLVAFRARPTERIPQLFEELQVWTRANDLVTVVLHQAGRTDEGVSKKYHGDTPMTAEGLLYGGEQQADIILGTYRPGLNPLGNMSPTIAEMVLGDSYDEEKHNEAMARVRRFKNSTFLQLLKNRPSTKGEWFEGVELHSPNDSQYIEERGDGVNDSAEWREAS